MNRGPHTWTAILATVFSLGALPLGGCGGDGKQHPDLTCPAGHEVDKAANACKPAADKCHGVACKAAEACNPVTGACEARCQGIVCPKGHDADAQTCVCKPAADKCHGVTCKTGEACDPAMAMCVASPGGGGIRTDLVNKQMSVGAHNNGGDVPNGNEEVYLDFNWQVGPKNQIVSVAVPAGSITVDGVQTGADEWKGVPEAAITMTRASDLLEDPKRRSNGTVGDIVTEEFGIDKLKVRSAYDGSYVYFRVEWADSTDNSARGRWIYDGSKWARDEAMTQTLPAGNKDMSRPVTKGEDRVQLMFNINIPDFFGPMANKGLGRGCAGLCHLEGKGGVDPANVATVGGVNYYAGKGRMYTHSPGLKADLWHWKSYRSNALRVFDDQHFTDEKRTGDGGQSDEWAWTGTDAACKGKKADAARYPGADTSKIMLHFVNEWFEDAAGCPSKGPSRVPFPYDRAKPAAFMFEQGSPHIPARGPLAVLLDGSFSPQMGDLVPGYIFRTVGSTATCLRCNNEAEGRYTSGTWTVEFKRTLVAPDGDDVDFTKVQ